MRGVGELASHVFGVAISRPTLVKTVRLPTWMIRATARP